jgi:hypothetical protein
LPDWTIKPFNSTSTDTFSSTVRNMREPGACQAFCETLNRLCKRDAFLAQGIEYDVCRHQLGQ